MGGIRGVVYMRWKEKKGEVGEGVEFVVVGKRESAGRGQRVRDGE